MDELRRKINWLKSVDSKQRGGRRRTKQRGGRRRRRKQTGGRRKLIKRLKGGGIIPIRRYK